MSSPLLAESGDKNYLVQELFVQDALLHPERIAVKHFDADDPSSSIIELSSAQLLKCSQHAAAHLLEAGCRPRQPGEPPKVLSIVAGSSFTYFTYVIGTMLLGWTPVLVSPRNSDSGILHLIETSDSTHVLSIGPLYLKIQGLITLPGVTAVAMKEFTDGIEMSLPDAFDQDLREVGMDEIAIYMHTSGTTGHPKLVPWTHRFMASTARQFVFACPKEFMGAMLLVPLPLFHAIGAWFNLIIPFCSGVIPVFAHSAKPIDGPRLLGQLDKLNSNNVVVFAAPATLEEVANIPGGPQKLAEKSLRVLWGGAVIRKPQGDALAAAGCRMVSVYGTTEMSCLVSFHLVSDDMVSDWQYTRFLPQWNILWRPISKESSLCELIVLPSEDETFTAPVINMESPPGYTTNDMWAPHPSIKYCWKHQGRMDSLTVLSNGEKTNNKQIENLLTQDSRVAHVAVFGSGHFLNGIIISPVDKTVSHDEFVNDVWPTIEGANAILPKHSVLVKSLVLTELPHKRFVLTDKATVRVAETLQLYNEEIEEAYQDLSDGVTTASDVPLTVEDSPAGFKSYLIQILHRAGINLISEDLDLFSQGVDSLIALKLHSALVNFVRHKRRTKQDIPRNILYSHSTIQSLVDFMYNGDAKVDGENERLMQTIIERYTPHIQSAPRLQIPASNEDRMTVLLTGATGSLGSQLLSVLLNRDDIGKIICLVRDSTSDQARERVLRQMQLYGVNHEQISKKLAETPFIPCDLSEENLGLDADVTEEIRCSVTHFIHNAWNVNFNFTLEQFAKADIAGLHQLLKLAIQSHRDSLPKFIFMSSISAVQHYSKAEKVPESSCDSFSSVGKYGYGMSKFVAERIVENVASRSGLPVSILRLGQLSGTTVNGYWNPKEFIPSALKSSAEVGAVPKSFVDTRWIPIDVAAAVIVKLCFTHCAENQTYFHVENPAITPWSLIIKPFMDGNLAQPVPLPQWISTIKQAASVKSSENLPVLKLLGFIEQIGNITPLDSKSTREIAEEVDYGPLGPELITSYILSCI